MILAGDIGGTKCNLALYEIRRAGLVQVANHRYDKHEAVSLPP